MAEILLWVLGFRGQLAYGDIDLNSSGSESEREFERTTSKSGLEFSFVGRVSAQYNKLWFQGDAFSGEVGSAFSYESRIKSTHKELVNIKVKATIPRLIMGCSIWKT